MCRRQERKVPQLLRKGVEERKERCPIVEKRCRREERKVPQLLRKGVEERKEKCPSWCEGM
jgi:hypothetical protein